MTLHDDEESALWYVGSYIIRGVTHRLDRSKCVFKEEMIFILIDRGGLLHCTNDFYVFLHKLEVVAKSIFKQAKHTKE